MKPQDKVKLYRKKLGYTIKRLAYELGVHEMTVWKWEKGIHSPPNHILLLLDTWARNVI